MPRSSSSHFGRGTGVFTCRVCGHRTRQTGRGDNEYVGLCAPCYDYAGWENTHSDNDHASTPDPNCPVCQGITDLDYARQARGEKADKPNGRFVIEEPVSIGTSQIGGSMEIRVGNNGRDVTLALIGTAAFGERHVSTIHLNKPLAKIVAKAIDQNADALK